MYNHIKCKQKNVTWINFINVYSTQKLTSKILKALKLFVVGSSTKAHIFTADLIT